MKTYKIIAAALAAASLASCANELQVQDHSFEFSAALSHDSEAGRNTLTLALVKGEGEKFTADYRFDGSGEGQLLETDGTPFVSGSQFSTDAGGRKTFHLKDVHEGRHMLEMSIGNGTYTQEIMKELVIDHEPFHFDPAVVTEGTGKSFLMLTLSEGHDRKLYTGSVCLDGRSLTGDKPVELDFSKESVWSITFPYLRPGRHRVSITVNDGNRTETAEKEFEEPLKYPLLEMKLIYGNDGQYRIELPFNPYGIRLKGKAVLHLKAQCVFVSSPPEQDTKVKTINDSVSIDLHGDLAETILLSQRDSIVNRVQQMKEKSALFKKVHTGGMIDPDWDYIVTGYEDRFYYLTKEEYIIDLDWEKVPGVSLSVDNGIGDIIFNGKLKVEGKFTETSGKEKQ